MSGHSKWANIKHRKGSQDARRSKLFSKLSKEITIAALKGTDPSTNHSLKFAISKAKSNSMPKKNIINAINKTKGKTGKINYKEFSYGIHIYGTTFLLTCLTDNVNRTTSEIQNLVSKFNGTVTSSNSVLYIFKLKGILEISDKIINEDQVLTYLVEAGAENFEKDEDSFLIYTDPQKFLHIKDYLESHNINDFITADIKYIPNQEIKLPKTKAKKILDFIDFLDKNDDVKSFYHNLALSSFD